MKHKVRGIKVVIGKLYVCLFEVLERIKKMVEAIVKKKTAKRF